MGSRAMDRMAGCTEWEVSRRVRMAELRGPTSGAYGRAAWSHCARHPYMAGRYGRR
jgi:hypothetical protein